MLHINSPAVEVSEGMVLVVGSLAEAGVHTPFVVEDTPVAVGDTPFAGVPVVAGTPAAVEDTLVAVGDTPFAGVVVVAGIPVAEMVGPPVAGVVDGLLAALEGDTLQVVAAARWQEVAEHQLEDKLV